MILDKFFKRKPQISLSPRTTKLIEDLRAVEWFANVGRQQHANDRVIFVASWEQAITAFTSETADNVVLSAQGHLVKNYHSGNRADWNAMIESLRPNVISLWKTKISEAKSKGLCSEQLSEKSFGDMLLALAYVECSPIPNLEYFDEILYWYLAGHFPCGWLGDVPEDFEPSFQLGKLLVF